MTVHSPRPPMSAPGIVPAGHPMRNGLVLDMPFWDGNGERVMDVSGNARHGAFVSSPTWVDSPYGKAVDFGTATEAKYVAATIGDDFIGSASTVSVLARLDAEDTLGAIPLSTTTGTTVFWQFGTAASANIWIQNQEITGVPAAYYDSVWRLYTFVSTGSTIAFYVNGTFVASAAKTGTALAAGDKAFRIGSYAGGSSWDLDGQIAGLRIWNYGQAAGQVAWQAAHLWELNTMQTSLPILVGATSIGAAVDDASWYYFAQQQAVA